MPDNTIPLLGLRDPISSGTHLVACLFALFASALMWRLAAKRGRRAQLAIGVFGISMVILYASSGLYHALRLPPERLRFYQLLDHSAIYILIAGTYTPAFYFLLPDRPYRRFCLAGIWLYALAGITCKWVIPDVPYWLTVGLYIGMGWVGVLTMVEMLRAIGLRGMAWCAWGGLFYTLGGLADLFQWPRLVPGLFSHHEVFHLCAMAGTFCHVIFMMKYVLPCRRRSARSHPVPVLPSMARALQPD